MRRWWKVTAALSSLVELEPIHQEMTSPSTTNSQLTRAAQLFLARPGHTRAEGGRRILTLIGSWPWWPLRLYGWLETFIGITSSIVARPATAATLHIILNSLQTWCIYSVYGSAPPPPKAPPLPIAERPSRSVRRVSTGHYVIFTDGQPKREREFYLILEGRRGIFLWVPPPSFSTQLTSVRPSAQFGPSLPLARDFFFDHARAVITIYTECEPFNSCEVIVVVAAAVEH